MDKLIIVGQVTGSREVAELPELDAYLQDGWRIREIQSQSNECSWQRLYHDVLAEADLVRTISPSYTRGCYQIRNCWMVDHSALVIAAYNGSNGGTQNTIFYAEKQGVSVRIVPA